MEKINFSKDSTLRLSCQSGDYLLWCGYQGILSNKGEEYKINDLWQLAVGNSVIITNRQTDLPHWFELHPLEVSGSLVSWMMKKLDAGYCPGEIVDGPNIWRVFAGDRLVWVGKQRQGLEFINGILSVITFDENAAVIGEPFSNFDGFPHFGGFDQRNQSEEDILRCRNGWLVALKLGTPRSATANDKWTIG